MVLDDSFEARFRTGRFAEILKSDVVSVTTVCQLVDPLKQMRFAQIMVYADRIDDAHRIIEFNLGRNSKATDAYCELLLGQIAKRKTAPDVAIKHFQSAAHLATESNAFGTAAWAYLHLFRLRSEIASIQELPPVLSEARRLVTQVGDPHLASYLHASVALREGQLGRVHEARRHLTIAASILERHPNAWLQQLLHMTGYCVSYLDNDLATALADVTKARALRTITGPSYQDAIIDANESHLLLCAGKLASALPTLRALARHPRATVQIGALDSLASLYLALNDLPSCAEMVSAAARADHCADSHNARWAACTRLALLLRTDPSAALDESDSHLRRAERNFDTSLANALLLIRAEALAKVGRLAESSAALLRAARNGILSCRDQRGNFYETCRHVLVAADDEPLGEHFRRRAIRVWRADGTILPQLRVLTEHSGPIATRNFSQASIDELYASRNASKEETAEIDRLFLLVDAATSAFDLAEYPSLAAAELLTVAACVECDKYLTHANLRGRVSRSSAALIEVRREPSTPVHSLLVANVLRIAEAVRTVARARQEERARAALWPAEDLPEGDGLFISPEMTTLAATARKVAPTTVPVLITGETGTGKEILARAIHAASTRAKAPFLPFNCSSGPRDMIDAQLFGHRRGAFTGATEHAPGVIRGAAGGTLFLDEIGESPLEVQPKLLRFLESGEIHPLGEAHPTRIDVRVIAATNVDLDAAVSAGRFREDLFYRLNIVRLHLPPLRERRVEIPVFAHHYLRKYAGELGKGDLRLAEETVEYLLLYRWPGNVRQLANEMRRMAALAETDAVLMPEHLSSDIVAARRTVPASQRTLDSNELVVRLDQPLAAATEHLERAMIPYALRHSDGRVEDAAQKLGLSRKGLYLKRMRLGLEVSAPQARTA